MRMHLPSHHNKDFQAATPGRLLGAEDDGRLYRPTGLWRDDDTIVIANVAVLMSVATKLFIASGGDWYG